MIDIVVNEAEIARQLSRLRSIIPTAPNGDAIYKKALRAGIKVMLADVRESVHKVVGNDKRQAYLAVQFGLWKKVLGGVISIAGERNGSSVPYTPPETKLRTGRGGNRMKKSAYTIRHQSYSGEQLAYVLRFLDGGAKNRVALGRANRGDIRARNFFVSSCNRAFQKLVEEMEKTISAEAAKL